MFSWLFSIFVQPPSDLHYAKLYVDSSIVYVKQTGDGWDSLNLSKPFNMPLEGDCDDFARAYYDNVSREYKKDFYLFYDENNVSHVVLIVDNTWVLDNKVKVVYHVNQIKKRKRIPFSLIPKEIQTYFMENI